MVFHLNLAYEYQKLNSNMNKFLIASLINFVLFHRHVYVTANVSWLVYKVVSMYTGWAKFDFEKIQRKKVK